jgi:uncharacterized oxidoreductase
LTTEDLLLDSRYRIDTGLARETRSCIISTQRVVLITGGTSGIGLGLAEAFLAEGAAVAVCGRNQTALDRFAQAHPDALAIRADITDPMARASMLNAVTERFGRLDVLINNAGIFVDRDFAATEATQATDELDEEMALNLTVPMHLTGETLRRWPGLAAIVFVTSGFAFVSPSSAPSYGAAKAGLHGFAEGLRRQLAPIGTHVLELVPPTTDTPMNDDKSIKKLPVAEVAAVTLKALKSRRPMALPGASRMLPTLLRIAPKTIGAAVGKL